MNRIRIMKGDYSNASLPHQLDGFSAWLDRFSKHRMPSLFPFLKVQ